MTVIDLGEAQPSLDDVVRLVKDGAAVLRKPDGTAFAIAQLDDFEVEVELLRNSPDFLSVLRECSREEATIPLDDLRRDLAL
jgi:hypothetical protein